MNALLRSLLLIFAVIVIASFCFNYVFGIPFMKAMMISALPFLYFLTAPCVFAKGP